MIHLLATFSAGLCAAGLIHLAYRSLRRKAPRYLLPLAAALAMLGYNVWNEYSWFSRTAGALPEHVVVVKEYTNAAFWKPWTYVIPEVDRFMAIDTSRLLLNVSLPDYVLAEVILVARRSPTATVQQLFDCAEARRTDVVPSEGFAESGLPQDPNWEPVAAEGMLLRTVCSSSSGS